MKTSPKGLELIKHYEGLKLKAYYCQAHVVTIGYGTTRYPDGSEVKIDDVCTAKEAEEYLMNDIKFIETKISRHFKLISQDQFDALVSWVYNLGFGNLLMSTLRKKILDNPNSPEIEKEFMKWIYADHKIQKGLIARRRSEWLLYSTGELNFTNG